MTDEQIKGIFLNAGYVTQWSTKDIHPISYRAARDLIAADRAQRQAVQEPCRSQMLGSALQTSLSRTDATQAVERAHGISGVPARQLAVECDECGATHRPGENTLCPTFRPQQIAEPAAATGWKWVPLEPTAEMLQAGQDAPVSESDEDALEDYKAVYRAMLTAAPHPQQIAGLDKDAEIAALKAERDALLKNDARYRFVVSSTDHSVAKWHDCEGWYAIEEVDLDADMQAQGVKS